MNYKYNGQCRQLSRRRRGPILAAVAVAVIPKLKTINSAYNRTKKVTGGKDTKKQSYHSRTHAMAKELDQALGMGKP